MVYSGLSAIHALLLSELLQRLIAWDRALLLQDGFVVRHAALVYSQLLVHFEEFVLHLLQTTGHIVRVDSAVPGHSTLAELLQGLLGALQLHLQVRQGLLMSADSDGQLFLLRHVLLQLLRDAGGEF